MIIMRCYVGRYLNIYIFPTCERSLWRYVTQNRGLQLRCNFVVFDKEAGDLIGAKCLCCRRAFNILQYNNILSHRGRQPGQNKHNLLSIESIELIALSECLRISGRKKKSDNRIPLKEEALNKNS